MENPAIGIALWGLALGAVGFIAGFFGPIALNPEANQGPLVGIFITGPGGLLGGYVLGAIFRFLPVSDIARLTALATACTLLAVGTLFLCLPEPAVRGYVVDGGCRDVNFILKLGFPVWCRYFTPRDIVGHWLPEAFDQPIRIGEVTIRAGDLALGDRDGMVILPAARAEEIVAGAEEASRTENLVRKAILEGVDPQEAYLRHGRF